MRVLLFSCSYAPRHGGLETATRRLARELSRAGHEVTVMTNRYPLGLRGYERIDGITVYRQIYPDIPVWKGHGARDSRHSPGRRTSASASASAAAMAKNLLLLPLAPVALLRLFLMMRRLRPDVVNVHYLSYPAAYMLCVAGLMRRPTVLSFHGSDLTGALASSRQRRFLRWSVHRSSAITTCSHHLAGILRHLSPQASADSRHPPDRCTSASASESASAPAQKVVVAHNGVDPPSAMPERTGEANPFFLVVARLVTVKGVDVAIRAAAELQRGDISARLLIVGDGPELPSLRELTREMNLQSRVTFLGPLPQTEVASLMRRAQLTVVPSRQEAFGMVCLEAMTAARAVVACRVGGIPEVVVDGVTGVLVAPDDPRALAGAIAGLLADPERCRIMGRRGRDRAIRYFGWDVTLSRYLEAYRAAGASVPADGLERNNCA